VVGGTVRDQHEVLDPTVSDVNALRRVGGYIPLRAQGRGVVELPSFGAGSSTA
jgi:hypothetical protein